MADTFYKKNITDTKLADFRFEVIRNIASLKDHLEHWENKNVSYPRGFLKVFGKLPTNDEWKRFEDRFKENIGVHFVCWLDNILMDNYPNFQSRLVNFVRL